MKDTAKIQKRINLLKKILFDYGDFLGINVITNIKHEIYILQNENLPAV